MVSHKASSRSPISSVSRISSMTQAKASHAVKAIRSPSTLMSGKKRLMALTSAAHFLKKRSSGVTARSMAALKAEWARTTRVKDELGSSLSSLLAETPKLGTSSCRVRGLVGCVGQGGSRTEYEAYRQIDAMLQLNEDGASLRPWARAFVLL